MSLKKGKSEKEKDLEKVNLFKSTMREEIKFISNIIFILVLFHNIGRA